MNPPTGASAGPDTVASLRARLARSEREAAARQRQLEADATIIMLTGMDDQPAQDRAAGAGADLFLTKPFSPLRLLRLVDELGHGAH